MTPASRFIQQLALVAVLILMIQSLAGIPQARWASPTELIIDHLFGIALWWLILW
ncbi:hypothetical protein BH09VER1_BH09VER1_06640 [soil metagenome]